MVEAFKQQGFEFVGKTDDGWFQTAGALTPPALPRAARVKSSSTRTFFGPPLSFIQLSEVPPGLPKRFRILARTVAFCYIAKGTVVLDIYDPVGQSLACLQRAVIVRAD